MREAASHWGPRDWNAEVYDRVSQPQREWGGEVVERLPLTGGETVLDAGCGSGGVTRLLLERLPEGRVFAVDASPSMVEKARAELGPAADVLRSDLVQLELDEPVDAIFSNAVFHWIPDHEALFARLHGLLRPGGLLVAQCGGDGNVASLGHALRAVGSQAPFDEHLDGWQGIWNFAGAEETRARLERAGFVEVSAWLEPKPITPDEPRSYLEAVTLGPHLQLLPESLHEPFVDRVLERMPEPLELDHVRLNITALRPR